MGSRRTPTPLMMLARGLLDRELAPFRKSDLFANSHSSWIKTIREALGMTTGQLAKRVGVSQPRITAVEKAEANDAITLKTLREIAEALDCKLIYALIPNQPMDATVRARATEIANRELTRTNHTMRLEDQALTTPALKRQRDRLVDELLRGDPRRLWDGP